VELPDQISWLGVILLACLPGPLLGQWHLRRSSPLQSRGGGSFALLFPEIRRRMFAASSREATVKTQR